METNLLFYKTIEDAQEILARWIVPDSKITDKEALSELLGVLDDKNLVVTMKGFKERTNGYSKEWSESPNVKSTNYFPKAKEMEIEFKNGNIFIYQRVPLALYKELMMASSIGSFLHTRIKGRYSYYQKN